MEAHYHVLVLILGVLGNIFSFILHLTPTVTLYGIFQQSEMQNYIFIPHSLSLFKATLMLYYANLKSNEEAWLLITISSIGCTMEVTYLISCSIYVNSIVRLVIVRCVFLLNVATFLLILFLTSLVSPLNKRLEVVGWIYATFSAGVYAVSLINTMRSVIRTKSVKSISMPISICLTLSSIVWFFYGCFSHDFYIALPNVQGFGYGVAQIILYVTYRNGYGGGAEERQGGENKEMGKTMEIIELENAETTMKNEDVEEKENGICRVELELEHSESEIVHLDDNIVTRNNNVIVPNEIFQSVAESEIVEIPDELNPEIRNVRYTYYWVAPLI